MMHRFIVPRGTTTPRRCVCHAPPTSPPTRSNSRTAFVSLILRLSNTCWRRMTVRRRQRAAVVKNRNQRRLRRHRKVVLRLPILLPVVVVLVEVSVSFYIFLSFSSFFCCGLFLNQSTLLAPTNNAPQVLQTQTTTMFLSPDVDSNQDEGDSNTTAIIAGVLGTVCCLLICGGIVVAAVIVSRKSSSSSSSSSSSNITMQPSSEANGGYSTPGAPQTLCIWCFYYLYCVDLYFCMFCFRWWCCWTFELW